MRLQLDPLSTRASELTGADAAARSGGAAQGSGGQLATGQDSSYVSGASNMLSRFSVDHTERLQQLASLVQSGSYEVSGAAVSRAIVDQSLL